MGEAAIFVRNVLCRPILLPLASGGARYLPACATTGLDRATRELSAVSFALAAGIVVPVMLPPPRGQPWRLPEACGLLSPVSAGARHFLAQRIGMERQLLEAKARERGERHARRDLADARRQKRERKRRIADLVAADVAARRWRPGQPAIRPPQWIERARALYRLTIDLAMQAEVSQQRFNALADGEVRLPELNGCQVVPRGAKEIADPDQHRARVTRYRRRIGSMYRLIEAAKGASGEADPVKAARWLIKALSSDNRSAATGSGHRG